MTFVPHLRLTMSGEISGGAEIFAMTLSLVPDGSAFTALVADSSLILALNTYVSQDTNGKFDDIVSDCTTFFNNAKISPNASMRRVKLAPIGADGKYVGPPKEAAVNVPGTSFAGNDHPWAVSQRVTLETDADLGRVKGGFYIPLPKMAYDAGSDLWSASDVGSQSSAVDSFLEDLANVPGFDTDSFKVVIASQGRHNKDGSVRLAAGNHEVKRVHMGRRPDTIRRRQNHVLEARIAAATVSQ